MNYQEFLTSLQKQGSKPHKLSHSLGARDAWKWVRRNKWEATQHTPVNSSLYGAVISRVNQLLVEKLLEGHIIEFPYQMGILEFTASLAKLEYKDGEIKDNYRIDWKKTLEYWYEDAEAFKNRKLIKRVQHYICKIHYSKLKARYKNQKYYDLRLNRSLVRAMGDKIANERINAKIY